MHFVSYSHSSLLPISKDHDPISTANSNLTSYNVGERMNEELPELLYLLSDFLPTKKNKLIQTMAIKYGPMQFILTEAFQRKIQMTLRWNHS